MSSTIKLLVALTALALAFVVSACSNAPNSISSTGPAIIGGVEATGEESFSQTVASIYNITESRICTASLLSDRILVTAAHCLEGPASGIRVVFGTNIADSDRVIEEVEAYEVSPLWPLRQNEMTNTGDIAVLKFSGGLPPGYKPAKILRDASLLVDGVTVMIAGFGISNKIDHTGSGLLRYAEVTIKDADFSESELLVDQSKGKGACNGDSGGPAYLKIDGEWQLWGVTNRGESDPKQTCGVAMSLASVTFYRDWIFKAATKLDPKFPTQAP